MKSISRVTLSVLAATAIFAANVHGQSIGFHLLQKPGSKGWPAHLKCQVYKVLDDETALVWVQSPTNDVLPAIVKTPRAKELKPSPISGPKGKWYLLDRLGMKQGEVPLWYVKVGPTEKYKGKDYTVLTLYKPTAENTPPPIAKLTSKSITQKGAEGVPSFIYARIVQIVSKNKMLVEMEDARSGDGRYGIKAMIEVSTEGFVDRDHGPLNNMLGNRKVRVMGTETYTTVLGASRTVYALKVLDDEEKKD